MGARPAYGWMDGAVLCGSPDLFGVVTRPWMNIEVDGGVLHARAGVPNRWDIWVQRTWTVPADLRLSRRRLARLIRQDLWRAAQAVRGFVPRVHVAQHNNIVQIKAGGVLLAGRADKGLGDVLARVLDDPDNKKRWLRFAGTKRD